MSNDNIFLCCMIDGVSGKTPKTLTFIILYNIIPIRIILQGDQKDRKSFQIWANS